MRKKTAKANKLTRRRFLKTSAVTAVGLTLPSIVPSSVFGAAAPSNRITIGCIGTGIMGKGNMRGFINKPDAQVVAICDVDAEHLEHARQRSELDSVLTYNDFRDVLARPDIDAVVVCTPDHWHVPISIAAARAGKDIYCEKPLSHNIAEGRALVDTVKRYGRVLQAGTQLRSNQSYRFACELVRNGRIGKVHTIKINIPENNKTCTPTWEPMPIPTGFNYDMWLGPAPAAPYTVQRCHYTFRFILDYSGGQMTNFGAHVVDIAQWGNGTDHTGPVEINGAGSEFPGDGLFNTATKVNVIYTYTNGVKIIMRSGGYNVRFEGSDGWVYVGTRGLFAHPASLLSSKIKPDGIHLYPSTSHRQNFIDCVKLRKAPAAPAEIAHRSATICHLGNISMRLGRKLNWDPDNERFINDTEADRMLRRPMRSPWYL